MEDDRYQQNSKLFVIGLICLLISLSLFAIGFYILPYLAFDWQYKVPGLVLYLREWYRETYNFSNSGASWMVFFTFIIPALICGFISQFSSNYIDNQIYHIRQNPERRAEIKKDIQETLGFGLKIALLIILVLITVSVVEWLVISSPPI